MAIHLKSQHITNMYTPIELITTGLEHMHLGFGGGVTDHGYLHGLADNDHPQYMQTSQSSLFLTGASSVNTAAFLGTGATVSFDHTSNSSLFMAVSNSGVLALTNHTHSTMLSTAALSDHSHGSVNITTIAGTQLTAASASSGLTIGVPNYITTYTPGGGVALQGSGTYSQNSATIQFANSNGVTFGLSNNGVMTASVPAVGGAQTGISGIYDYANVGRTAGSVYFSTITDILPTGWYQVSHWLSSDTMWGAYQMPIFLDSNNIEMGASFDTNGSMFVTALANFSQSVQTESPIYIQVSGNTSGTMTDVSSGTMILHGGSNITFNQDGNDITVLGGGLNVSLGTDNTLGTRTIVSSGTMSLHAGSYISLSQDGNNITIVGPAQGGVQTGISGIAGSNTTFTSGTVIWSGQNNITIGSFATSNSQYIRLSVPNFLTTAALSGHTHGSNVSTQSTSGTNIQFSSSSNGLTMGIPAFITTYSGGSGNVGTGFTTASTTGTDVVGTLGVGGLSLGVPKYQSTGAYLTTAALSTHIHGTPSLNLSLLTGAISSASNGMSLSITGPVVSNYINTSQVGTLYFMDVVGLSWGSTVNGVSTSIYPILTA